MAGDTLCGLVHPQLDQMIRNCNPIRFMKNAKPPPAKPPRQASKSQAYTCQASKTSLHLTSLQGKAPKNKPSRPASKRQASKASLQDKPSKAKPLSTKLWANTLNAKPQNDKPPKANTLNTKPRRARLSCDLSRSLISNWSLSFLASQDALEVMYVSQWVSQETLALTWLMWLWWVMITIKYLIVEYSGKW